jgi:Ca2+/Na+ antiporter
MVADVVVAKQGFQEMAIAACFGGPLFSIHLTFFFSPSNLKFHILVFP